MYENKTNRSNYRNTSPFKKRWQLLKFCIHGRQRFVLNGLHSVTAVTQPQISQADSRLTFSIANGSTGILCARQKNWPHCLSAGHGFLNRAFAQELNTSNNAHMKL